MRINFFLEKEKYVKLIEIDLNIQTDNKIVITDNCKGIENLDELTKIGNSTKQNDVLTNGQFGFGIYSFISFCREIEFYSRTKMQVKGSYMKITKKNIENNSVDSAKGVDNVSEGTKIILSDFKQRVWNDIDSLKIKQEIEKHFEILLKRENLVIKVNEEQCKPYNYEKIKGEPYEAETSINLTYIAKRKKVGDLPPKNIQLKTPIQIYLRLSENVEIKKPPVFFIKGRRVNEVKNITNFHSVKGSKEVLWGHGLITGYIDLKDNFEPTITRDKLKDSEKLRAFFQYLNREIEPYIYGLFIEEKNKERMDSGYKSFASVVENLLANILKKDLINFRKQSYSSKGEDGLALKEGFGSKDFWRKK